MKRPLLVLGAATPIGRGVVRAALEAGRPVIAVVDDAARNASLHGCATPDAKGSDLLVLANPLADDADAAALADRLRRLDRPLEGIVAALCIGAERGRLLDHPVARLRQALDDNLVPHLAAARHLLPLLAASNGGYVLVDGPGGEHPWAGYGHRSVGAAALRMLARVLHDEARALPVRVQMLSVELPVRTEANATQACIEWPSAISIGRRALALIEQRDSEGAAPLVHCAKACDGEGLTLAREPDATSPSTPVLPLRERSMPAAPPEPDIADTLLTSRCLQDVRTLLDQLKSNIPMKGDSPR